MPLISVVIPVCNEEESLPLLFEELRAFVGRSPYDFEFIFVDDGSSDNSFRILKDLATRDLPMRVLKLSRNFGSHPACSAGFLYSKGDACATFPADLQDPPEIIGRMAAEWEKGFEVVFSVKESNRKSLIPTHSLYYKIVRRLALKNMPLTGVDLCLVDRKVVETISGINEKNTSLLGLILWSGFSQTTIRYKKRDRIKGVSKWTFAKKLKLLIDTVVSFSFFPVRIISVIGLVFSVAGFLYAILIIINRLLYASPLDGWSSLMVVLLIVSGIQMMMTGVIGEYLWRNYDESRKRPNFIVSEKIGFDSDTK